MPTLSIYDPERLWEFVERPMMVYMPLRKLSAKVRLPAAEGLNRMEFSVLVALWFEAVVR